MKHKILFAAVLLGAAMTGATARAEDKTTSSEAANPAETPAINHVVYLAQLPAPADLIKAAAAQGTTITRMDQTNNQIVVVYQYAGGRSVAFAYTLLSAAGSAPGVPASANQMVIPSGPAPAVATTAPSTTVVYTSPPPAYYYPTYVSTYDPVWDFWAPVAIGIGLGWGWHGGHWYGGHGGWHGGHGGFRH